MAEILDSIAVCPHRPTLGLNIFFKQHPPVLLILFPFDLVWLMAPVCRLRLLLLQHKGNASIVEGFALKAYLAQLNQDIVPVAPVPDTHGRFT